MFAMAAMLATTRVITHRHEQAWRDQLVPDAPPPELDPDGSF